MSSVQARLANIDAMGQELGDVYSELWQHLARLHQTWGHFEEVFAASAEAVSVLNATAPNFFRTVQDTVWESVLLRIARLTDRSRTSGKENLSFMRLSQYVVDAALLKKVRASTEELSSAANFARDWRNRRLAHNDLDLSLNRAVEPLAPASTRHVEDVLACMGKSLNVISLHYQEKTTFWDVLEKPSAGGGTSMLHYLQIGQESETRRHQMRRSVQAEI